MSEMVLIEAKGRERGATATWLLATAAELGFDPRLVKSARDGYLIPAEMFAAMSAPAEETKLEKAAKVFEAGPDVGPDRETVRAWAKENGLDVADKGRLKQAVYDAFAAAHAS